MFHDQAWCNMIQRMSNDVQLKVPLESRHLDVGMCIEGRCMYYPNIVYRSRDSLRSSTLESVTFCAKKEKHKVLKKNTVTKRSNLFGSYRKSPV